MTDLDQSDDSVGRREAQESIRRAAEAQMDQSVWRTDSPPCPRCGLTLHVDDPCEGYHPDGKMKLKHATSTETDCDGCIVGLGRAVAALNDRLADLERGR